MSGIVRLSSNEKNKKTNKMEPAGNDQPEYKQNKVTKNICFCRFKTLNSNVNENSSHAFSFLIYIYGKTNKSQHVLEKI